MPHDKRLSYVSRSSQIMWLATLAFLVPLASGCSLFQSVGNYIQYSDSCNDFVLGWRNRVWSRQSWHERKHQFAGQCHLRAFGDGFRAGYTSVASGGNGCPPALPPRTYWTWKYQTPEGQAKVAAWFDGFPHGAQAAEEEQAGFYSDIQVSYLIEQQYSPEFRRGEIPQIDQPLPNFMPQEAPRGEMLNPGPQLAPPLDDAAGPLLPLEPDPRISAAHYNNGAANISEMPAFGQQQGPVSWDTSPVSWNTIPLNPIR